MLHWLLQNTCVTDGDAHMAPHHVRVAQDFKIAEAVEACQTDSDEEEHDQQVLAMMMPRRRIQIYESGPDTKEGAPRTLLWAFCHAWIGASSCTMNSRWSKHGRCARQFGGDQKGCTRAGRLLLVM